MQQQFNGGQITKGTFVFREPAQSKHIPHMLASTNKGCAHAGEPAGWTSDVGPAEEGGWEAKKQQQQEEEEEGEEEEG